MGESLAKPPLIEAVCEFRFTPTASWDWTIPGRLYDLIKGEFSERGQVEGIKIVIGPVTGGQLPTSAPQSISLIRMKRPDNSALVQVGHNLIAINHLLPYKDWRTYSALIVRVFDKYKAVVGEVPEIQRAGLRYINQIPVKGPKVDLATVISTDPPLKGALGKPLSGFYQRFEIQHSSPEGVLILQTGLQQTEGARSVVVDLDFGSQPGPNAARGSDLKKWLNAAHDAVEESFLASLSPDCLARMKKGPP